MKPQGVAPSKVRGIDPRPFRLGRDAVPLEAAMDGAARQLRVDAAAHDLDDVVANAGGRALKVGIVALARKLLIALWRYLEDGLVPDGARLKTRVA
jgi:hypothetical protein